MPTVHLPELPPAINRRMPRVVAPIGRVPPLRSLLSRLAINYYGYCTARRPMPLTLRSDYTSWSSLTDRSYSARHLPPADDEYLSSLPPEQDLLSLFRREKGKQISATDTSVMFMFFAQWFVDSFLTTDREDFRRNHSNHDIDLCEIYGLRPEQTELLRAHGGGRLKSQMINGEEYPPFLFEPRESGGKLVIKKEFKGLHDEAFLLKELLGGVRDERKDSFFATGLIHGNSTIGNTIMNTLWVREHNRLARILEQENPQWDDDRLFETARNIAIVLMIKIVVEEYITHIGPWDFPVEMVEFVADHESWNRTNWCAIEFNLLYRWHMLAPDYIGEGPDQLTAADFLNNNPLVLSEGIESLIRLCSNSRAGKIGLFNTPYYLVDRNAPDKPSVEERSIALSRKARLKSYNDYREAYSLPRLTHWKQLNKDPEVTDRLKELYGDIDRLEWYVGIFAEGYADYQMMGELITTMVANDAFTQALTNPLLSRNVFNETTFTKTGFNIIKETSCLQDVVARNSKDPSKVYCKFSVA